MFRDKDSGPKMVSSIELTPLRHLSITEDVDAMFDAQTQGQLLEGKHLWQAPDNVLTATACGAAAYGCSVYAEELLRVGEGINEQKGTIEVSVEIYDFASTLLQMARGEYDYACQAVEEKGWTITDDTRDALLAESILPVWPDEESVPGAFLEGTRKAYTQFEVWVDDRFRSLKASSFVPPNYAGFVDYAQERLDRARLPMDSATEVMDQIQLLDCNAYVKKDIYPDLHAAFAELLQTAVYIAAPRIADPEL